MDKQPKLGEAPVNTAPMKLTEQPRRPSGHDGAGQFAPTATIDTDLGLRNTFPNPYQAAPDTLDYRNYSMPEAESWDYGIDSYEESVQEEVDRAHATSGLLGARQTLRRIWEQENRKFVDAANAEKTGEAAYYAELLKAVNRVATRTAARQ